MRLRSHGKVRSHLTFSFSEPLRLDVAPETRQGAAMAKKDSLEQYRSKRDFKKTSEPPGKKGAARQKKRIFVIQKHDASRLHYDFRLEIDGVLKSWAVPKGPSTNPSDKRLAIRTEDHPMDYADFEGTIPEDEYGGGTVMVWDAGRYKNLRTDDDGNEMEMNDALDEGKIEISLSGRKLQGGYVFVKTRGRGKNDWLLIKKKDDQADARRNPVSTQPNSVISGRSLEEIAAQEGGEEKDKD
jgi:DNA ligase D-like protein (predicted 3'-phosphoesterase)